MSDIPPWQNFGKDMNTVLNRIGSYCRENAVAPEMAIKMFHCGIASHHQLIGDVTPNAQVQRGL